MQSIALVCSIPTVWASYCGTLWFLAKLFGLEGDTRLGIGFLALCGFFGALHLSAIAVKKLAGYTPELIARSD